MRSSRRSNDKNRAIIAHSGHSKATVSPAERDILKAVLAYLAVHPKVAWAARMNTGAIPVGNRLFRAGFVGCSDIIGQMRDGRFLAIEVKREGKRLSDAQYTFLSRVTANDGVALVARSISDCEIGLQE